MAALAEFSLQGCALGFGALVIGAIAAKVFVVGTHLVDAGLLPGIVAKDLGDKALGLKTAAGLIADLTATTTTGGRAPKTT